MTTFNISREIAASVEEVFAVFSLVRLAREWEPDCFTKMFRVCEFKSEG